MKLKWRMVLVTAPLGILLALFQNCGQNTRQVRVTRDVSTPGGLVNEKPLEVLTFGTLRAHVDLSDSLSSGSEATLEMTSYSETEDVEINATKRSKNLLIFPLSLEGMCPSPDAFLESPPSETVAAVPGSGYLIRDTSTQKFVYLLFTGFTGERGENDRILNLIQMSFVLISPKPNIAFNLFLNDICGEPPLAMGPGLQ